MLWAQQPPPSGDGLLGAIASFFRAPTDFELSPAAAAVVAELCREEGWDIELELGSLPARAAGGTGTLVRSSQASPPSASPRACASGATRASIRPKARCGSSGRRGCSTTRGVLEGRGRRRTGVPRAVQMKLEAAGAGIVACDVALVPPGPVYLNARVASPDGAPLELRDGKVTVKEDVGGAFVFDARGILAEYKIVGTFEAAPAARV